MFKDATQWAAFVHSSHTASFGTDFTHVQSCDVTLVQSAIRSGLLPYILHIRTSCSTVEGYLQAVTGTSRHDVTCRSCRGQGASRHVTSRHVRTSQAPLWTRRPRRHVTSRHVTSRQDVTGAAVDKEAVTSRHVTSGHHRRRRGQGCRHVTSRQDVRRRRGQGGRRVTSRHVTRGQGGRHVTSRHVTTSGAPRADHAQEMGFQFLSSGIIVLSPSDPRLPTVRFDSIVVLAGGRRRCIGLGGVGFAPSNEDLAFRAGVCHLMDLFLRTMVKLRQGPVQFLGLFFGH